MSSAPPPTDRVRLRRLPQRGAYDRDTIDAILDAGFLCHVGVVDGGHPVVIPTAYARVGDAVVIHGSSKSRLIEILSSGADACITVSHVDGLVLARSAFHTSINYRAVVLFGRAAPILDPEDKARALEAFFERVLPGRWPTVRAPNEQELKATGVVRIPLAEASAKIRTGGPLDDAEDLHLPVWAGVIPMALTRGTPIADPPAP